MDLDNLVEARNNRLIKEREEIERDRKQIESKKIQDQILMK